MMRGLENYLSRPIEGKERIEDLIKEKVEIFNQWAEIETKLESLRLDPAKNNSLIKELEVKAKKLEEEMASLDKKMRELAC